MHIETYSKNVKSRQWKDDWLGTGLTARAVECTTRGHPASYGEPEHHFHRDTPSHLFPPPLEETSKQVNPPRNGMDDRTYITDDDFLRDLRDYTSVLEPNPGASADHIAVGGLSDNPPAAELLEQMSEITRRDTRDGGAAEPPQEGAMPGGGATDGVSQEVVLEPQEQAVSRAGASLETPLARSPPLQQRGHSRLEATPAVTRAGTAAKLFMSRNAYNRSDSAYLAAIATGPALSELRGQRLYTKESLPHIAHEAYGSDYSLECWKLDYNTAFLNADVTEGVYVEMAPGYEQFDENGVSLVMRLSKSPYGLRQSPINW